MSEVNGFRPLSRQGRAPPLAREDLRIAVVVPTTSQMESWGAWLGLALQRMGYDVRAFPYRDVAAASDPESMNRQLLRQVRRWDSGLVVVVKGELVSPHTLESLRKDNCRLVLLANDDHQVWEQVSKPLGRRCERVFTFTKGTLPWYEKEGIPAEHMLFYADPVICAPEDMPKLYDASFAGTYYPERETLVKAATQSGLTFKLLGDGWNRSDRAGWLPDEGVVQRPEYVEVLRTWHSTKMCLNIHQEGLRKLGVVANLRCYELAASGCFMVSDRLEGMEEAFGDPLPFATWEDPDELLPLLRYWVNRDEERRKMSEDFRQVVLERHTPEKRAQQILDGLR